MNKKFNETYIVLFAKNVLQVIFLGFVFVIINLLVHGEMTEVEFQTALGIFALSKITQLESRKLKDECFTYQE